MGAEAGLTVLNTHGAQDGISMTFRHCELEGTSPFSFSRAEKRENGANYNQEMLLTGNEFQF